MDVQQIATIAQALRAELGKVIVGQASTLDAVIVALLSGGHVLIEGPPGTAKTLLVRALALALRGEFRRAQFTPDVMPADLIGVNVYRAEHQQFEFRAGPLFCDLLLADEINRAPAKTQSALLEAMQERQVTVDGETRPLSPVFTTFATQNPVEYEGTYPLPEAQLDRFMFKALMDYPGEEEECQVLRRYAAGFDASQAQTFDIEACTTPEEIMSARGALATVRVAEPVQDYIAAVIRATRRLPDLTLGASPRAGVILFQAARGLAVLRGRDFVTPDDVRDLAQPTLRHRLVLSPEAEIEGTTADAVIGHMIERVPVPRLD
jgi:MoxR-like ATPase